MSRTLNFAYELQTNKVKEYFVIGSNGDGKVLFVQCAIMLGFVGESAEFLLHENWSHLSEQERYRTT